MYRPLWGSALAILAAAPSAAQTPVLHETVAWLHPAAEPVVLNPYGGWIDAVAFEAGGTRILADTDKTLFPLDLTLKPAGEGEPGLHGMGDKAWFSPDATKVYVATWTSSTTTVGGKRKTTRSGELKVVARASQQSTLLATLSKEVASFAVRADGSRIALGFEDGSFQILDGATGKSVLGPVQAFPGIKVGKERIATVTALAFSPDGARLVLGDTDGNLRFFDTATGKPQGKPVPGHTSLVECIAFSADGKLMVTASQDMGLYRLDAATGKPLGERLHLGDKATALALSPDGTRLVTGHFSGKVRLWQLEAGK